MSPLFSFSTWFLNRRDQLVGMRASFLRRTANTSSTSSSLMTSRRPISSALSAGHHQREVAVGEPQHEVVALLAEGFLLLTLLDRGGTVVGVDDLVADVERHDSPCAKTVPEPAGIQVYQTPSGVPYGHVVACPLCALTLTAMRKTLGLLLLLGVVTACVPNPPPGARSEPHPHGVHRRVGTRSPLGHRVHARRSVDDLRRAGRKASGRRTSHRRDAGSSADPPDVVVHGEGGLLGLAVDPNFASNHFLYACYDTVDRRPRRALHRPTCTPNSLAVNAAIVTGMPVNTATGQTLRLPAALPAGHQSAAALHRHR